MAEKKPIASETENGDLAATQQAPSGRMRCSWKWIVLWIFLVILVCSLIGLLLFFFLPRSEKLLPSDQSNVNPLLLPGDLWPRQYNVTLRTFLEYNRVNNLSFDGSVQIELDCLADTNILKFHALGLNFGLVNMRLLNLNVTEGFDRAVHMKSIFFDNFTQMVTVELDGTLKSGNPYLLSISMFTGFIRLDAKGFYLSTYKTNLGQKRFLAATQFEVAEARRAFPCFDEPRFKANFSVTILRRISMISLSNMERTESINRGDGWFEDQFATSVRMSTYLVAFVVCDFQFKQTKTESGITIRAFSRPDAIHEVDHVLHMTVKMLKYFEDYFDIPYALNKLDLISLPDFSHGAMENWGLITFKETAMLYNAERDTKSQRQFVSMILGHEVAHQWFGNLVTMEWWNDLWLNEGFANYMGYVSAEAVDPDEPMENVFIYENALRALQLDSMKATHAILTDVSHPDEIAQLFDAITYRKGSCLIRMMIHFLGDAVLQKGLRIYLKKHSFANTVSQDLWNALDEAVAAPEARMTQKRMNGMSVGTVMDSWIKLTGYPFVTISRYYDGSRKALVSQDRFIANRKDLQLNETKWYVPFTYTDAELQNWKLPAMKWLFTEPVQLTDMPSDSSWVVGNVDYTGFYRVNYDERNWELLIKQLRTNHRVFSVPQRSQILDDTFAFSWAELLDVQYALNATAYLKREEEYLPWLTALDNLRFIDNILQGSAEYTLFQDFMRGQLRSVYVQLGWAPRETENKLVTLLRERILTEACHYGMSDCLERSKTLFQFWMNNGNLNHVPLDLRYTVSCYGVQQGGSMEWEFVWRKYVETTSNKEHQNYIKYLSCTRDSFLLKKLLFASLNTSLIRTWHVQYLYEALSKTLPGRESSWSFLRKHWERFFKLLHETAGNLAVSLNYFNEPFRVEELKRFMTQTELGSAKRRFKEAKEVMEGNIRWKGKNRRTVVSWLKNFMTYGFLVAKR